jgi:hypothetical protein
MMRGLPTIPVASCQVQNPQSYRIPDSVEELGDFSFGLLSPGFARRLSYLFKHFVQQLGIIATCRFKGSLL